MNMSESSRIILGLRAAGWDEKAINDFILWVETGEEQYKPKQEAQKKQGNGGRGTGPRRQRSIYHGKEGNAPSQI